jgi:hypothetical protein
MHEQKVSLYSKHQVSAIGAPTLLFHRLKKKIVVVSPTLGFWSMRHSAISEEEVDFQ